MSGLREALEDMVTKADRRVDERKAAGRVQIAQRVDIGAIRDLLAAHPAEPAPVADRQRITEVLATSFHKSDLGDLGWDDLDPIAQLAYTDEAQQHADALLAAGVFRDEAEVKAEALDEAAEHIRIPGASSLAAAWLQGRATKLRGGDPS